MKKNITLLIIITLLLNTLLLKAQNIAINSTGNAPNSSAMLDVQSTTKGMLIPRMTTAQRTAIASPATGLLVFDNSTGSFWFKNATKWVELTDSANNTWTTKGSDVYVNNGENVGIGTNNPFTRLEIDHGTDVNAGYDGYLQLGSTGLANLAFDNNEIQARNNYNTSALYLQNNGGNLQVGSASGTATDIHINNGKLIQAKTGSANMMPLCYGHVSAGGTLLSGTSNVTITKGVNTAQYFINCTGITSSTIMIAISNKVNDPAKISVAYYSSGRAKVVIENFDNTNNEFSFIFYNP